MVSSVSNMPRPSAPPTQAVHPTKVDADGDHDGDKAPKATSTARPQPHISKPTATMGNHVNTVA